MRIFCDYLVAPAHVRRGARAEGTRPTRASRCGARTRKKWPANARRPESVVHAAPRRRSTCRATNAAGTSSRPAPRTSRPSSMPAWNCRSPTPARFTPGAGPTSAFVRFVYNNIGVGVSLGLGNVQLLKHDGAFSAARRRHRTSMQVVEEMEDEFLKRARPPFGVGVFPEELCSVDERCEWHPDEGRWAYSGDDGCSKEAIRVCAWRERPGARLLRVLPTPAFQTYEADTASHPACKRRAF